MKGLGTGAPGPGQGRATLGGDAPPRNQGTPGGSFYLPAGIDRGKQGRARSRTRETDHVQNKANLSLHLFLRCAKEKIIKLPMGRVRP